MVLNVTSIESVDSSETVTITKAEYNLLLRADLRLQALNNNGVDNWDFYGDAMDDYHRMAEEKGIET